MILDQEEGDSCDCASDITAGESDGVHCDTVCVDLDFVNTARLPHDPAL